MGPFVLEDNMADTETPTEVPVPTPAEVVETPKTEAAPEATPAEETKPEAEPTETKPEPEPIDPYDELGEERFKSVLESRDRRQGEQIRADYQTQYEQAVGNWKATEAHKQLAGIYGNILQKLEDGDADTVGKLVGRLEEAIEPYSESYKKGLKAEGSSEAAQELYGVVKGSLDSRGQDELQDYLIANRGAGWGDILKKRDEIREGKVNKSSSDEITSLEATIEDLKAKARPEGPDTTPKGGPDGRSDEELKLDPTTSVETLREIRARERL
jgi:hypothetical protein